MNNVIKICLVVMTSVIYTGCADMAPKVSPSSLDIPPSEAIQQSDGSVNLLGFASTAKNRSEGAGVRGSASAISDAISMRFAPRWRVKTKYFTSDRWSSVSCTPGVGNENEYTIALNRKRLGVSNGADVQMSYRVTDHKCNLLTSGRKIFPSYTTGRGGDTNFYTTEGYYYAHSLAPVILGSMTKSIEARAEKTKKVKLAEKQKLIREQQLVEKQKKQRESQILAFKNKQPCPMKETEWFYTKGKCVNGLPQGYGEVVHREGVLAFKGNIKNGIRTKGIIIANGVELFDGIIKNGKPDGQGICFHKNEPEECKFYRGKRVDAIYKQRIAFQEQQRDMDKKLAEMQASQKTQLNKMQSQLNSTARVRPQARSNGTGDALLDGVGDVLLDKAADKAMDKLFDHLF